MMISMCGIVTVLTVICLCGLLAFAKYYDCDILKNGTVQRMEQVKKNTLFKHLQDLFSNEYQIKLN